MCSFLSVLIENMTKKLIFKEHLMN